jgi:hypothetical protein
MLSYVWGGLVTRRITSDAFRIGILINSNIVDLHDCWKKRGDSGKVQGGKPVRHTKIDDGVHGFLGKDPLANISIRSDGVPSKSPGCLVTNKECRISISSRFILKGVSLIAISVIPLIVEIAQTRNGLLEGPSTIRVNLCDGIVINFHEFCEGLVSRYTKTESLLPTCVRLIPDVEWCQLERLRNHTNLVSNRVERMHASFQSIQFRS